MWCAYLEYEDISANSNVGIAKEISGFVRIDTVFGSARNRLANSIPDRKPHPKV